jgi:hypothetical protein
MKARAILNSLYQDANSIEKFDSIIANNSVDTALLALKEMVLSMKKNENIPHTLITNGDISIEGWNSAIKSVAKLFEEEKG